MSVVVQSILLVDTQLLLFCFFFAFDRAKLMDGTMDPRQREQCHLMPGTTDVGVPNL